MEMTVWEVYERDSQRCVAFAAESDAMEQEVFEEVDLVAEATVEVSETQKQMLDTHGFFIVE